MEVFKGVLRNHGPMDIGPAPGEKPKRRKKGEKTAVMYRYVVMGMIVTDEPIREFATKKGRGKFDDDSTFVLAGEVLMDGLSSVLTTIPVVPAKRDIRGFTANQILTGLNEIA